jgi:hypothetical protein
MEDPAVVRFLGDFRRAAVAAGGKLDIQNQDAGTARHAYRTADYQVSKQEMAALWRRYYVWSAYRNKALQTPGANVAPDPAPARIASKTTRQHRAYHSGTFATPSGTKAAQPGNSSRRAYRMLQQGVHKPVAPEAKRHAYESTCNFVLFTVS